MIACWANQEFVSDKVSLYASGLVRALLPVFQSRGPRRDRPPADCSYPGLAWHTELGSYAALLTLPVSGADAGSCVPHTRKLRRAGRATLETRNLKLKTLRLVTSLGGDDAAAGTGAAPIVRKLGQKKRLAPLQRWGFEMTN